MINFELTQYAKFQLSYRTIFSTIEPYENKFPPIKVYCYNLTDRYRPDNEYLRHYMYLPDSPEFKYYIEVEVHKELLLSPILTADPEEADFFYIPVYPFATFANRNFSIFNFNELISELRRLGPYFDRKNGADHIMTSGFDFQWFGRDFVKQFMQTKIILCAIFPIIRESWKDYEYKRFIAVPHISFFPDYPYDKVDWNRKRKNTVFLAQTYKATQKANQLRKKISNEIEKIKNHDLIIFTREKNDVVNIVKSLPEHYIDSDFCVCPKGDNPVAKRNFDGPYFGCIPVYVSDYVMLPFAGNLLDYSKFSIRIPEKEISSLHEILESYSQEEILNMRKELKKCAKLYRFRLGEPPRVGEGFWAISWMWYIRYLYNVQFDYLYYPIKLPKRNISSK